MARPGLHNHRKFKRLVQMLGQPVPHVHGHLECLWLVAYENGDPLLGEQVDVELAAQWAGEPGALCKALLTCGGRGAGFIELVEGTEDTYQVHDLHHHAPEYVSRRKSKEDQRRKKKACEHCGAIFHSSEARTKFCSHACRTASYRARAAVTHVTHECATSDTCVTSRENDNQKRTIGDSTCDAGVTHDASFQESHKPVSENTLGKNCDARDAVKRSVTFCDGPPAPSTRSQHPLPPPPKKVPAESRQPAKQEEEEALVVLVRDAGVDQAISAVGRAIQRGCTGDEIAAAVACFRRMKDVGPGALYRKLMHMAPGDPAGRGFPEHEKPAVPRKPDPDIASHPVHKAKVDAEDQVFRQLESIHGESLDNMPATELRQLVAQLSPSLQETHQRSAKSPIVRFELLKLLDRQAVAQ